MLRTFNNKCNVPDSKTLPTCPPPNAIPATKRTHPLTRRQVGGLQINEVAHACHDGGSDLDSSESDEIECVGRRGAGSSTDAPLTLPMPMPAGHVNNVVRLGKLGSITYYGGAKQEFYVVCDDPLHQHRDECTMEVIDRCRKVRPRTASHALPWQGRFRIFNVLVATTFLFTDAPMHKKEFLCTFEGRTEAWEFLRTFPGAHLLFEMERRKRTGESDEPADFESPCWQVGLV